MEEKTIQSLMFDEDFVISRRYKNSLKALIAAYPDGTPEHIAAPALGLTVEELDARYLQIVQCLKGVF